MKRPTDQLRTEHAVVSRGVQVLCAQARAVHDGGPFPAADCAEVLRFLREWVLAVHMRKEDDVLAPAAAMRGDERTAQVVGELMRLHEEIAELSHSLVLFWEPAGDLTTAERQGFVATVEALVERLRRRETLEEQTLFPTCDRCVPADDQLDWQREFDRLEGSRRDFGAWQRRIDRLAAIWID